MRKGERVIPHHCRHLPPNVVVHRIGRWLWAYCKACRRDVNFLKGVRRWPDCAASERTSADDICK